MLYNSSTTFLTSSEICPQYDVSNMSNKQLTTLIILKSQHVPQEMVGGGDLASWTDDDCSASDSTRPMTSRLMVTSVILILSRCGGYIGYIGVF